MSLPSGVSPITGFTFNSNQIIAITPTYKYSATSATAFEACTIKGLRKGIIITMIARLNGSPQGIGSKWVISSFRVDIDQIIVQPVDSKGGCMISRKMPLWYFKNHFVPTNSLEYAINV